MTLAETIELAEKLQASLDADEPLLFYVSDADRLTELRKALPVLLSAARRVVALEGVGGSLGEIRRCLPPDSATASTHAAVVDIKELCVLLCLAFWDGESKGTLDTIRRATKAGVRVRIIPEMAP